MRDNKIGIGIVISPLGRLLVDFSVSPGVPGVPGVAIFNICYPFSNYFAVHTHCKAEYRLNFIIGRGRKLTESFIETGQHAPKDNSPQDNSSHIKITLRQQAPDSEENSLT